jgi:hypothetical protein
MHGTKELYLFEYEWEFEKWDEGKMDRFSISNYKEIFSNLFVDFIGELIIRDNIDEFVVKINKLDFNLLIISN